MSAPLRVMHVVEAMHQGGAESLIVEHVRLAGPGVEPLVCALNRGGPALEAATRAGARTFVLDGARGPWARLQSLARLFAAERVSVANGHNPTGGMYAAAAGALARVPVVRTEHSVHYPGRHSRAYELALEPLATALSRTVVCVCEAARASHAERLRWAETRFVTVPNGVSDVVAVRAREVVRADLGLALDAPVALTVGSLTPQKAQLLLLAAFQRVRERLPAARLLIAGEGPLREALTAEIDRLGLAPAVHLLGPRSDVADLMEAADVFTLSSEREGLSVTLLESMRAARAAVVTRVGGNPEAVMDGETGTVVPFGDAAALGQALGALLADPSRARGLGTAARARWARCFTAERMVSATESVYRDAIGLAVPTPNATGREREGRRASA